jgi:hypothetical protein
MSSSLFKKFFLSEMLYSLWPCAELKISVFSSVADPNPDPPDPHVFGPPGSGSFYHHAKIARKTLISTIL